MPETATMYTQITRRDVETLGWRPPCVTVISLLVIFVFASTVQAAQEDLLWTDDATLEAEALEDIDLLELEVPTVITATRREQQIATVPYAISVITAEDIRLSGARSVAEALRLVPGVDVAEIASANSAVSPRGFHGWLANQVLVLVDGRQIYDAFFGGTLWTGWPIQLEDVQRIEVIRGPGGLTWGANAVNGVINIITKDPGDQLGLRLMAGGGSHGMHKEYFAYADKSGKLRFRVSGEFEASDGFVKGGSILRKLEDEFDIGRLTFYAVHESGPNDTLTISAGGSRADGGAPPTPLGGFGLRQRSGDEASFLLVRWDHQIAEDNRFELTGFVNDFGGTPGIQSVDFRYQQLALQFNHTFRPVENQTLTWGIDSRLDLLDATNSDPFLLSKSYVTNTIIGLYVQDEWRFTPKWTLGLGSRVDYDSYGGFQPSTRAALSYQMTENSMVYGAVSRSFHMPVAASRFLNLPLANGLIRVQADRDLVPVSLVAYEIGYRGKFFDRLEANANVFWHEFDDQTTLSPQLGPPALLRINFDNCASASMYGVELDGKLAMTKQLILLGHYTFQQLDWRSSAPFSEKDLMSPPKHKFMLGTRYSPIEGLHLSSHLYYVDAVNAPNPANPFIPRHVSPYFRLDLRAEYEFWDDRASIAVGVSNLLDPEHYEGGSRFLNDAEVPRTVYAELRLKIK